MRQLVARKEEITIVNEELSLSTLTLSGYTPIWGGATVPVGGYVMLQFTYNGSAYALIQYRKGETLNSTYITNLGLSLNVIPIFIESTNANQFSMFINDQIIAAVDATVVFNSKLFNGSVLILRERETANSGFAITFVESTYGLFTSTSTSNLNYNIPTEQISLGDEVALELDNETALGVDIQGWDIKNPARPKISVSNSFSIPRTLNNEKLTGFGDSLQSKSNNLYETWRANYYIDNALVINNGKLTVERITPNRIHCRIVGKESVWDRMKETTWDDFMEGYFKWLIEEKSFPVGPATYSTLITTLTTVNDHLLIPFMYSHFFEQDYFDTGTIEEQNDTLMINLLGVDGGHICTYIKSLFEYINYRYDVNFFPSVEGSIFDDAVISKLYIQNRHIKIKRTTTTFEMYCSPFTKKGLTEQIEDKASKNVYDFVLMVIQQTNAIVDRLSENEIALRSFDSINNVTAVNWGGLIEKDYEFTPSLDGIAQVNTIDFSKYSQSVADGSLRRQLFCYNRNIEGEKELFKINAFVPRFANYLGLAIPALYEKESFDEFTLLGNDSTNTVSIKLRYKDYYSNSLRTKTIPIAAFYGLNNSYTQYESIIAYPKVFKIRKWLDINDVNEIEFFKRVYIPELGGNFFINKISGFNPEKSRSATEVELIYIPE